MKDIEGLDKRCMCGILMRYLFLKSFTGAYSYYRCPKCGNEERVFDGG